MAKADYPSESLPTCVPFPHKAHTTCFPQLCDDTARIPPPLAVREGFHVPLSRFQACHSQTPYASPTSRSES